MVWDRFIFLFLRFVFHFCDSVDDPRAKVPPHFGVAKNMQPITIFGSVMLLIFFSLLFEFKDGQPPLWVPKTINKLSKRVFGDILKNRSTKVLRI